MVEISGLSVGRALSFWDGAMAKETRQSNAKVRIFYAEVEGADHTIQDGLRTLGSALVRACQPQPLPRIVKALPAAPAKGKPDEASLFDHPGEAADQSGDDEVEAPFDNGQELSIQPTRKEARERKLPTYSVVKNLDLRPNGKQ